MPRAPTLVTPLTSSADVSVVIPHYESQQTLGRAIASVLNQTVLPAEILVIDDASSPAAQREARQVVSSIEGIEARFVELPRNSGPGAARNAGWDLARNGIVAFLDADDAWLPGKVEAQSGLLVGENAYDAVGHRMLATSDLVQSHTAFTLPPGVGRAQELRRGQWLWRNQFATSSVMVRRDLSYRFSPHGRYAEDFDLWLRLAFDGRKMGVMDERLGVRYQGLYGESGLSTNLWAMERGELAAFRSLRAAGNLSFFRLIFAQSFSLTKYLRRVARVAARKSRSS